MDLRQEEAEIKKTLQFFFDGFDHFDAGMICKAFYSDKAEMFSIKQSSEKLQKTLVKSWDKKFEQVRNTPDHIWNMETSQKNVVYIDIAGTAANAKVEYIFSAYKYTDYYNLLKIDGRWYIMNKTFDTEFF